MLFVLKCGGVSYWQQVNNTSPTSLHKSGGLRHSNALARQRFRDVLSPALIERSASL